MSAVAALEDAGVVVDESLHSDSVLMEAVVASPTPNASERIRDFLKSHLLTDGDATTDEESQRETAGSPPPNCAICLGKVSSKCFTDSCMHQFCFSCLLEWSKVSCNCIRLVCFHILTCIPLRFLLSRRPDQGRMSVVQANLQVDHSQCALHGQVRGVQGGTTSIRHFPEHGRRIRAHTVRTPNDFAVSRCEMDATQIATFVCFLLIIN